MIDDVLNKIEEINFFSFTMKEEERNEFQKALNEYMENQLLYIRSINKNEEPDKVALDLSIKTLIEISKKINNPKLFRKLYEMEKLSLAFLVKKI